MSKFLKAYRYFIVVALFGFMLTGVLYEKNINELRRSESTRFNSLSSEFVALLQRKLEYSFSALEALDAFYRSSQFVDRSEFKQFATYFLQAHPDIKALEWVPVVRASDFEDYQRRAKKDSVRPLLKGTNPYYPVFYVEPLAGNEQALGYNLGVNKARLGALIAAEESHKITITEPIQLVQGRDVEPAILVLKAIYSDDKLAEQVKMRVSSYVLMVLRVGDLYQSSVHSLYADNGIAVDIRDELSDKSLLGAKLALPDSSAAFYKTRVMQVGQRRWLVSTSAPSAFMRSHEVNNIIWLGTLISVLLATIAQSLRQQALKSRHKEKLTKMELKHSQNYYKTLVDTDANAIISINEQGIISEFNAGAEKLFGYSHRELVGENVSILMEAEHAFNHDQYIRSYLESGESAIIGRGRELQAKRKNGDVFPVFLMISDTGVEGDMRFIGVIKDLSKTVLAEKMLKQHKTQLEEVVATRMKSLKKANKTLKKLSETDPLTKISNRRVYENSLMSEVAAAKRTGQPLSLLMIDIDLFKGYNDGYGHAAGDLALTAVAQEVSSTLPRKTDVVTRYGGEEFVVLLMATDAKGALGVAENIRTNVQGLGIEYDEGVASGVLTISIGVASLGGDDLNEVDLPEQADKALYAAKKQGRNRCVVF